MFQCHHVLGMGGVMDELPEESEPKRHRELSRPRIALAPQASEFLADRLTRQHRDELETRPMKALTPEVLEHL